MTKTTKSYETYNTKYECFISSGAAFLLGIIAALVFMAVRGGFFQSDLVVRPVNETATDIEYFELVFDAYSIRIPGAEIGMTTPSPFFTVHMERPSKYKVEVKLSDGRVVVGELRSVDPGCGVVETIYLDRVDHFVRACR